MLHQTPVALREKVKKITEDDHLNIPFDLNNLKGIDKVLSYFTKNGRCYLENRFLFGGQLNPRIDIDKELVPDWDGFNSYNYVSALSSMKFDNFKMFIFISKIILTPKFFWYRDFEKMKKEGIVK